MQCSENEIYDVYIRDDDTLLRTELECRYIYIYMYGAPKFYI